MPTPGSKAILRNYEEIVMALRQVLLRNSIPAVSTWFCHEAATVFEAQPKTKIHPPFFNTSTEDQIPQKHNTSQSCQIMSKYDLSPWKCCFKQPSAAWRKYSRNTRTVSLEPGGTAALTCVAIGATTTKEVTLKRAVSGAEK